MKPKETEYKIAEDGDHEAFGRLLDEVNTEWVEMSFPTIVALREGEVIGGISRHPTDDRILVEPIFAPNIYVYIRLIEAMENVLAAAGVKWFDFRVDATRYEKYTGLLKKSNAVVDLGVDDEGKFRWFRRTIHGRQ